MQAFAFTVVGLFAQDAAARATVLAHPGLLRRVADFLVLAVESDDDLDPRMTSPHSYAMLALAYLLRACDPQQAAAAAATLTVHMKPGGLVTMLMRSASRSDWVTPHRGWAFMALEQLAKVSLGSVDSLCGADRATDRA